MSSPRPLEQGMLAPVERRLASYSSHSDRLEVLEAAASTHGCFDLEAYRALRGDEHSLSIEEASRAGAEILEALRHVPIHASLALSALARPPLTTAEQRKAGAYYTDFRLASFLAGQLPQNLTGPIIDAACGSGILLVATTLRVCGSNGRRRAAFLRDRVCGADLSDDALRGALLALASLTDDIAAIAGLHRRLRCMDSLVRGPAGWADVAPSGFSASIGNPPWEKLKVSRHEHLRFNGHDRHYGADYNTTTEESSRDLIAAREHMSRYVAHVSEALELQGSGEADLYKIFLELCLNLVRDGGHMALLVPAGLIRSRGTAALRAHLLEAASSLRITVMHNHARFFAIDTRFKFLSVAAQVRAGGPSSPLALQHGGGTDVDVSITGTARLGRTTLRSVRPDVSLPEVRSDAEWRLFRKMHSGAVRLGDPSGPWQPHIVREVDMTRERPHFRRGAAPGTVPVIEGRMVHQYRAGAKRYIRGTGRSAVWEPVAMGERVIAPQFYMSVAALRSSVADRITRRRVGFCDITGQTNERSMLTALIPAGVVCGNKVPTIVFGEAACNPVRAEQLNYLWLAIGNSLPFDWLLRRVVTTTVNFFLLLDLPMPSLNVDSLPARRLIDLARRLTAVDEGISPMMPWEIGCLRAKIDVAVAAAYGLSQEDVGVLLKDFPLLDRGQPVLEGTANSVTRDVLQAEAAAQMDHVSATPRVLDAWRDAGAAAYVPADYAHLPAPGAQSIATPQR